MGLYDWVVAWDHAAGRVLLLSTGLPEPPGPGRAARAHARAAFVRERLARPAAPWAWTRATIPEQAGPPVAVTAGERRPQTSHAAVRRHGQRHRTASAAGPARHRVPDAPGVASTFRHAEYLAAVDRTREYIRAGDIFQANISQRLEAPWRAHPFELYQVLRQHNPAPFAAYLDLGDATIVSASPERFLQLRAGVVETRPIKGTAPRGLNPMHDLALEQALLQSEKDRAENTMIVDLLRNDLSRVCCDHTVDVPELCALERYAGVHHLVSTVTGRLLPGRTAVDLLRAAFPGGSITGAPKVRAMEIIAELEPTRRGPYTGSIGYIGFDGTMDTSIVIRTLVVRDGTAYFQVGGGIVADSDPEREYRETLDKAGGMLDALEAGHGAARR